MRARIIFLLYRLLQAAGLPLLIVYLLGRGIRDRRYFRGLLQRLGFMPRPFRQTAPGSIWLHAVSVGEVLSSVELLRRLRSAFPPAPLYVSTTTLAGLAIADEKLHGLADRVFYAPIDYCFAVRRVLRALRPRLVIVLETEIWPNLYREARRSGASLLIVNGRISDRAWPRYRRLRWFFRHVLELPDAVLAQNELSRRRYVELGAPADRVRIGGNLKYDFDPRQASAPEPVRTLLERAAPREVWIAASTMPPAEADDVDEDEAVVEAFQRLAAAHRDLLLMLVPRRPARFESAAETLRRAGVPFLKRSEIGPGTRLALPGVLLVDSIGELSGLFQLADVVFMGGTLARRGGHNILEPAAFAQPIIVGPHMENFPAIIEEFRATGAVLEIREGRELAHAVEALLADPARRAELSERARRAAAAEQGATGRACSEARAHYWRNLPLIRPPLLVWLPLWVLSRVWLAGCHLKRWAGLRRRVRLRTPVVSVGGLSMGGAGKTPFVLWLAARLKTAGWRPAVLLRGYRRQSPGPCTILESGEEAPAARTGDEAQIYLRSGLAPVGIGADRAAVGRLIEDRFRPDVFLLDDGFQHWPLARALDIVLIDALDPFAGGAPFPLGRLREPPGALRRAHAIVITRCEPDSDTAVIEERIRMHNAAAPLYRARVAPQAWVDARSGHEWDAAALPYSRVAAFCGLANPASFWQTLATLGCRPVVRRAFPDHHRYTPSDLRALRAQDVEALLTTEKDLVNLCAGWSALLDPLPLLWLKIGLEVDDEAGLLGLITRPLRPDTG